MLRSLALALLLTGCHAVSTADADMSCGESCLSSDARRIDPVSDLRQSDADLTPVADLKLVGDMNTACVLDRDCYWAPDQRCVKGVCWSWTANSHCGNNHGTDPAGEDCTHYGDPAVICCLDKALSDPLKARCTSINNDVLNCGACQTVCKLQCIGGTCAP